MVRWWIEEWMDTWMDGRINTDRRMDNRQMDGKNVASLGERRGARKTQGEGTTKKRERCVWDTETG